MIYNIDTEDDYQDALKRFFEITGKIMSEEEEKELNLLMHLMEKYERNNCSAN